MFSDGGEGCDFHPSTSILYNDVKQGAIIIENGGDTTSKSSLALAKKQKQTTKHSGDDQDQHAAVFCPYNAEIEQHLHLLHAKMRTGNRKYQSEIDRYIIACSGERFQHLILPRGHAPHYDNLPDFSFYAISILDPSKDGIVELQQIFLLLRQCTPLRRRTKRAQRELQWEPHSIEGMHHLIISMQVPLGSHTKF
jgi:hypothetical protein